MLKDDWIGSATLTYDYLEPYLFPFVSFETTKEICSNLINS
jgi:hypothetical protein